MENEQRREILRAERQAKIDRKIERLRKWSASHERQSAALQDANKPYMDDWAFVTQPILVGHHSERSHRRLRDRIARRMDKSVEHWKRAEELKKTADWLAMTGARVKGDAERKREEQRKAMDALIAIGSKIYDFVYRGGVVTRVNKKTYSITFASGLKCTRDKSFVKPLDK
jgi:hypothetical protein